MTAREDHSADRLDQLQQALEDADHADAPGIAEELAAELGDRLEADVAPHEVSSEEASS